MQTETYASTRSPENPIAVVETFLRALEDKEFERAVSLLADDVVYQNMPFPADRGKPAVVRTLELFEKLVTKFEARIRNIAAQGGTVLTERVDVLSGRLFYLDIPVCGTFEVRDGKIVLWRDYFDLAETTAKLLLGPLRKLFVK